MQRCRTPMQRRMRSSNRSRKTWKLTGKLTAKLRTLPTLEAAWIENHRMPERYVIFCTLCVGLPKVYRLPWC